MRGLGGVLRVTLSVAKGLSDSSPSCKGQNDIATAACRGAKPSFSGRTRGSGVPPETPKSPNLGGYRGLTRTQNTLCLICPGGWLLPWMQFAPFLKQLPLGLTMRHIGHAGTSRAYLSTVRGLIGSHALGAPVRIDGVCRAESLVGAPWPTVSTQPGNCSALFSDDFVGYRLSFLSSIVFTIVPFPLRNVNQKR